ARSWLLTIAGSPEAPGRTADWPTHGAARTWPPDRPVGPKPARQTVANGTRRRLSFRGLGDRALSGRKAELHLIDDTAGIDGYGRRPEANAVLAGDPVVGIVSQGDRQIVPVAEVSNLARITVAAQADHAKRSVAGMALQLLQSLQFE